MLHLSEDGPATAGSEEDDAYPIPHTLREQAEYEQEHLERAKARKAEHANECHNGRCPSLQHLDAEGVRAWAHRVYDQIQQGKREMFVFPQASQNAMIVMTRKPLQFVISI